MIRVTLPQPPPNYNSKVKKPGKAFLKRNPNPTGKHWKKHKYWAKIHNYLYNQHKGICLYCASWTPRKQDSAKLDYTSVDHFQPKTHHPDLAYEWSNFRLCRARLNNYKSDFQDILDPCSISDDWFYLDFTSFLIKPSSNITDISLMQKIKDTVERLHLNSDNDYVDERINAIKEYSLDKLSSRILSEKYPFIAYQMRVQNFDYKFKDKIKFISQPQYKTCFGI
ncbi:MAG: hypothetical protein BWK80_23295 [Desulfobacteraceae bacterium IS3]|nr:MAG: hypothetical protein BWK80_23295 [Desulfobacteraceae bacterium IS3]